VYEAIGVKKMSLEHRDFVRPKESSRWRSGAIYRVQRKLNVGLEFELRTMFGPGWTMYGSTGQSPVETLRLKWHGLGWARHSSEDGGQSSSEPDNVR
jgi:hypothetical protein